MSTRTRAEAFARSLEDGTAGGHRPLVDALAVARTQLAVATTPDAEYRERLRTRLLAVATVQEPGQAAVAVPEPRRLRWLRPVAGALAGVVVLAGALVGVDAAARNALPGDLLYGVKRAHQAYDVRHEDGPLLEGVARLHLAQTRLAEVRELAGRGSGTALGSPGGTVLASGADADLIRSTLRDMDALTRRGSRQVEGVIAQTGDPAPWSVLEVWTGVQSADLRALEPVLPSAAQDQLASSLTLVADLRARTVRALGEG